MNAWPVAKLHDYGIVWGNIKATLERFWELFDFDEGVATGCIERSTELRGRRHRRPGNAPYNL